MRTIYLDADYKCHFINENGTMTAVKTDFFDGKCQVFIEGYRFIPEGETWTRPDGKIFQGEMIAPWQDYNILVAYQDQYERTNAALQVNYYEGVNSI